MEYINKHDIIIDVGKHIRIVGGYNITICGNAQVDCISGNAHVVLGKEHKS